MIAKPNKTRGRLYLSTILMVLLMLIGTVSEGQKCDSIGWVTGIDNMPTTASGFIMAGAGMVDNYAGTSKTIKLTVPDNAEIKKVLVYWQGIADGTYDNKIEIGKSTTERVEVTGTLVGLSYFFSTCYWAQNRAYRADITDHGIITGGGTYELSVASLEGFNFRPGNYNSVTKVCGRDTSRAPANNGIGVLVIYDIPGRGPWPIFVMDGNDFDCPWKLCTSSCSSIVDKIDCAPSTYTFTIPSTPPLVRKASLGMFFASVSGSASNTTPTTRPNKIRVMMSPNILTDNTEQQDQFGRFCFSNDGQPTNTGLDSCSELEEGSTSCTYGLNETGYTDIWTCTNPLNSWDGGEWDTIRSEFYLRPSHENLSVEVTVPSNGASLSWVATVLMIEPLEQLKPKPRAVLVQ